MANEVRDALRRVRTLVSGVSGIRKVSVSRPASVPHPPVAYLTEIRGTLSERAFQQEGGHHLTTIRVIVSKADADDGEEKALAFVDAIETAIRADFRLSNTVLNVDAVGYVIDYVTVGETIYRSVDFTIDIWIDK